MINTGAEEILRKLKVVDSAFDRLLQKNKTLEAENKRLRSELLAADEHAKRLEAVIEKMTAWEPSKEGRLG